MYYSIDPFLNARGCCRLFLPRSIRSMLRTVLSVEFEFKELSRALRITCATNTRTRVNLCVALLLPLDN